MRPEGITSSTIPEFIILPRDADRPWRLSESVMNRPMAFDKPILNEAGRYSSNFRPLGEIQSSPIVRQQAICSLVVCLFFSGGPSAVSRFVVPVIVDAVNGMTVRRHSHVVNEELERCTPSFTDVDSAPTIEMEVFSFRIGATVSHAAPYTESSMITEPVRLIGWNQFPLQTATTFLPSGSKIVGSNGSDLSAITLASPSNSLFSTSPYTIKSNQSANANSSKIDKPRQFWPPFLHNIIRYRSDGVC